MSVLIKGMKMPTEGKVMTIYKLKGEFFASFNGTELYPLVELSDHEDLIDREKDQRIRLVNADALLEKAWDADTRIGYVQVVDVGDILDAPTIEMEQRKGKWIKQNPMVDTEECSECGYNILGEEFETPFCPWCGAKMDNYK